MLLTNGLKVETIELMYKNEIVASFDVSLFDFNSRKITKTNIELKDRFKNPAYGIDSNDVDSTLSFLEGRRIALGRPNRSDLFPNWCINMIDELYITKGQSMDDNNWLRFMPSDSDCTFENTTDRGALGW